MTSAPNPNENLPPETTAIVEVTPQPEAIVETELADQSDEIKQETRALIEAIRQRAQAEAQGAEDIAKSAGDFTRDTYLRIVRQAREAIEQNRLFDPAEVEKSAQDLRQEAEKNWQALVSEVTLLSDRLSEAAQAAWQKLVEPRDQPPKD